MMSDESYIQGSGIFIFGFGKVVSEDVCSSYNSMILELIVNKNDGHDAVTSINQCKL